MSEELEKLELEELKETETSGSIYDFLSESTIMKILRHKFPKGKIYEERDVKEFTMKVSLIKCPKCDCEREGIINKTCWNCGYKFEDDVLKNKSSWYEKVVDSLICPTCGREFPKTLDNTLIFTHFDKIGWMCSYCLTIILKNDIDYDELIMDNELNENDVIDLIDFCDDKELGFRIGSVNDEEKVYGKERKYCKITFYKKRRNVSKIEKFYDANMDFNTENEGLVFGRDEINIIPEWCGVYIYDTISDEKYVGKSKGNVRKRIKQRNEMIRFIKNIRVYFTRHVHDVDALEKKLILMIDPELNIASKNKRPIEKSRDRKV